MKKTDAEIRPEWKTIELDVLRLLVKRMGNRQDARDALSYAWDSWMNAPHVNRHANHWAALGRKRFYSGRALQGMEDSKVSIEHHATGWQAGGMQNYSRVTHGVERVAMVKELFELFLTRLNRQQWCVAMLLMDGYRTKDVADTLKITPGRVSQHRRAMMEVWRELTA